MARLTLFFTGGMSLAEWDRIGMLEREVAIYRALMPHLDGIDFVTYGNADELRYAPKLEGIRILCNRWNLRLGRYMRLLPLLHILALAQTSIIKTNQTAGAGLALKVKRLYSKPMIARCGYMWSEFASRSFGADSPQVMEAQRTEARVFRGAERVVVTTAAMKQTVVSSYGLSGAKVRVIPNYVCTDHFHPLPELRCPGTLCFVGRLDLQKNVGALIEALTGLPYRLTVVGDGVLREDLEARAAQFNVDVEFISRVPHLQLPQIMNQAEVFIQPSLYEGHPKTLIEAMSCGLPVIGADSPGIGELLQHDVTGYLCGIDPPSIRAAICEVMGDAALRARLGQNAQQYVVEHFTLERVLQMELDLYAEMLNGQPLRIGL